MQERMRSFLTGLLLVLGAAPVVSAGGDFDRTVRALREDDRTRRREALEAFADGRAVAASPREGERLERELVRFLTDQRAGSERALAVRALGRLTSDTARASILARVPAERDDRVLAASAEALTGAPSALAAAALADLERTDDDLAQAALLRMLGRMDDPLARERILLAARTPGPWVVRAAAIEALGRRREPAVVEALIGLLDEDHPGLRAATFDALRKTTRRSFRGDVGAWKGWWAAEGHRDPLAGPPPPPQPPGPAPKPDAHTYAHEENPEDHARPYFFGIPVSGSRVVFVFDVSASMRSKLPLAYDQLTRAVEGLPPAAEFEVIFFNEQVWPWRDRLSRADPVTKELLARHLPTIEIKSYTNLYDSLERALELAPDEILCISDGEPNRGRHRIPRDILEALRRANPRHVPIHTVSVVRTVDGDEHLALLREIAEQTGGTHIDRTLR